MGFPGREPGAVPALLAIALLPKLAALLLALAAVSACTDVSARPEDRQATTAILTEQFDEGWLPEEARLWESSTDPDRCEIYCPQVEVSYTYMCLCSGGIEAEMVGMQERVSASGFTIIEPYSLETGVFEARMAVPALEGKVHLHAYGSDSGVGQAQIIVTLIADDLPGK